MPLNIKQLIEDKSGDRDYFAMVPAMLWPDIKLCSGGSEADAAAAHAQELGISLTVHDRWLYVTLKKICGEKDGQCFMSSRGLAKFAGMSAGQLSKSKAKLEQAGLITIVAKKRSVKGWAIDHITVVDAWGQNIGLIKARQRNAHQVNTLEEGRCSSGEHICSPSEQIEPKCSPHERNCSPGETEEEPIEEEPKDEEEPKKKTADSLFTVQALADLFDEVKPETPEEIDAELREAGYDPDEVGARMKAAAEDAIIEKIIEQTQTHPSPEDLALVTEKKQAEKGNYATPAHAGGDDLAASCAYTLFCEMQEQMPTTKERESMILELSELLKPTSASIEEIEAAFEIMADDFVYRIGNYNVFQNSFKQDLRTCIARARAKTIQRTAPRHQPESALLSQEALQERQAARPAPPQDDAIGQQIKTELALQMDRPSYQTWVAPTRITTTDGDVLIVNAPTDFAKDWIENRLASTIERIAIGVMGKAVEVRFETVDVGEYEIPIITVEEVSL